MTDFLLSIFLFVPLVIILSSWLENPKRDLLDIRIILAFLYFLGGVVRPLYLINTDDYVPVRYSLDDMQWFLAISTCAIAFILLTIGFKAARRLSFVNTNWGHAGRRVDRRVIWLFIGIFALAGAYGAYIKLLHAEKSILSELPFRVAPSSSPSGYFTLLRSFLYVSIGLVYWDILQFPKNKRRLRFVILATVVLIAMIQPVLVGARSQILNILFILIVPFHYLVKRITIPRAMLLGVFMTTVVVFLGATRGTSVDVSTVKLSGSQYSDFLLRSHRFYDLVSIGKIIDKVPREVEHLNGSSLMRFFVVPVPREVWPDKPVSLGQIVGAEIYGIGIGVIGGGVPPSIVGELYFNFGMVGVVVGMFLFGVLMRAVYSLVNVRPITPARVIVYAFSLMGMSGIFIGAFTLGMLDAIFKIVPFFLILAIGGIKKNASRRIRTFNGGQP